MPFIEYEHSQVAEELFTCTFASVGLVPTDERYLVGNTEVVIQLTKNFGHESGSGIRCELVKDSSSGVVLEENFRHCFGRVIFGGIHVGKM